MPFDDLDAMAERVAQGDFDEIGTLSTGEYLYVALAANSTELLSRSNDTIVQALARLGPEWTAELISRWQYRGNPARQ